MYNLPSGVTAALVIKDARSCTSNPCDFESEKPVYPTVACVLSFPLLTVFEVDVMIELCRYASPLASFSENKFWQAGKQGAFLSAGIYAPC
jgi:hypothetical protein